MPTAQVVSETAIRKPRVQLGIQKVTFTPVTRRTCRSRKLKRSPVKSLELPKLRPHFSEGMSRLWEWRAGAAASANPSRTAAAAVRIERRNVFVMAMTSVGIRAEYGRPAI